MNEIKSCNDVEKAAEWQPVYDDGGASMRIAGWFMAVGGCLMVVTPAGGVMVARGSTTSSATVNYDMADPAERVIEAKRLALDLARRLSRG